MRSTHIVNPLIWITLLITNCTLMEPSDCPSTGNYPIEISPLSSTELQELQEDFNTFNSDQLCPHRFDSYGFIEPDGVCARLAGIIPQGTEDLMITRAKEAVVKFGTFTNVPDTSMLVVQRHGGIGSSTERILVVFRNQIEQGLEVMHTDINVWLSANAAMHIYGGWYKEILVPECDKTSEAEARAAAIGTEITYYDIAGQPNVFIVSEENISETATRVVVPVIKGNSIELRVAWRFSVRLSSWYLFVDTTAGEVVRIDQLFVT